MAPDPFVAPYHSFLLERTPKAEARGAPRLAQGRVPGLIPASGALDPGSHIARQQLDLPSLVAQRPEVDALASRAGVVGEQRRAVLSGADAELGSKLVGISVQERSQDVAKDPVALGAIAGNPGPHRGERIGKALRVAAAIFEHARQAVTGFGEAVRRRVVGGGKPAVSGPRDPAQSGARAPTADPQRYGASLPGSRREFDMRQGSRRAWTRLSLEQRPQRCNRLVEQLPALLEREAQRIVVALGRTRSEAATSRPSESTSRAASVFASGTGPRRTASESVVARVMSPVRSITLASAVGPSSQGVEKMKWSLAETAASPQSRAASTACVSRPSESPSPPKSISGRWIPRSMGRSFQTAFGR